MDDSKMCSSGCNGVFWWVTLLAAVLAVPSAGFIVASVIPADQEIAQILVFILACWFSTFLGMRLMQHPSMKNKVGSAKK